jgi:SSS family solute:Na+ symporter
MVAIIVFIFFFLLVTVLGFVAARWRQGDLNLISEWGLAGRRFGTLITWFLLGGDLYTAYTFIAVPGAMYGSGALAGWYAVPYTILVYPLIYLLMPRFWSVCKQHGYVTAADFVKDRFNSRSLALAVAFTGILATLPYIALQMFGIEVSLQALGIPLNTYIGGFPIDFPLLIAFLILAAYTYTSGLRAPAMIAMVKDVMIFIVLFAALIYIPIKLGGFGVIFNAVAHKAAVSHATALATHKPQTFFETLTVPQYTAYTSLALGSVLALFLYPHSLTSVLSSSGQKVIKRNMALLPIYSLMLGLLALLGYMAIAAKLPFGSKSFSTANFAVPALINFAFPPWFAGFAFAAISIGALVPAAVMSIAAANLFTRNIYKEYFNRNATDRQESQVAKLTSFIVKFGALLFIVYLPTAQVIVFQQLGGIWILQTLVPVYLGLYTNWFNRWALLIGWLGGMVMGTAIVISNHFASTIAPVFGILFYAGFSALILNVLLSVVLTPIFEAIGLKSGRDLTVPSDYDVADAPVETPEVGREALG